MTPERITEVRKILSGMNERSQLFPITVGDLNSLLAALEELHNAEQEAIECRLEAIGYHKQLLEAQQTIARQREALEGVQRIIQSGEFYETADNLKSVLVSANWACVEALREGAKES